MCYIMSNIIISFIPPNKKRNFFKLMTTGSRSGRLDHWPHSSAHPAPAPLPQPPCS